MADEPKKLTVNPERPKPAPGFWSLADNAGGLHGSVDGVKAAIAVQTGVPAHSKTAILEQLAEHLDGTGHNHVTIHAHAQRRDGDVRHTIIGFDIISRKML